MPKNTLTETILKMATMRGPDKTVCPSEIARELFPDDWRRHMQEVRDGAIALQLAGRVTIIQKGNKVDPEHIKGPIRIKIA